MRILKDGPGFELVTRSGSDDGWMRMTPSSLTETGFPGSQGGGDTERSGDAAFSLVIPEKDGVTRAEDEGGETGDPGATYSGLSAMSTSTTSPEYRGPGLSSALTPASSLDLTSGPSSGHRLSRVLLRMLMCSW